MTAPRKPKVSYEVEKYFRRDGIGDPSGWAVVATAKTADRAKYYAKHESDYDYGEVRIVRVTREIVR